MPSGKVPGSFSPSVPFSEPKDPMVGPKTSNTNRGRDVNTLDRKMPVSMFDDGTPKSGTFGEGTCLGEWGKRGNR